MAITRTKTGCFNCRKRKKKCDETKPDCAQCLRIGLLCRWPQKNEILPKDYQLPPTDNRLKRLIKKSYNFVNRNEDSFNKMFTAIPSNYTNQSIMKCSLKFLNIKPQEFIISNDNHQQKYSGNQEADRNDKLQQVCSGSLHAIPSNSLTDEGFLMVSIHQFLKGSGPQFTHPKLSPITNFGDYLDNKIFRKVLTSCGCIFLLPVIDSIDLITLANKKYIESKALLKQYCQSQHSPDQIDNWIIAAYHLVYIISKLITFNDTKHLAENFQNTYSIIKKKYKDIFIKDDEYLQTSQKTQQLMIHNLEKQIKSTSSTLTLSLPQSNITFDKCFLESFIYQYSVSILTIKDLYDLPSNPYRLFDQFRDLIQTPIFNCDVSWMNNPILGAASDVYEYVAKASYLSRLMSAEMIFDPNHSITSIIQTDSYFDKISFIKYKAERLLNLIQRLPKMSELEISLETKLTNPLKFKYLQDSIILRTAIYKTCLILLRKLLDMDLTEHDELVQSELNSVVNSLSKMNKCTNVKTVSIWIMLVAGCCCITESQKRFFIRHCNAVADINHSYNSLNTVKRALFISWNDDNFQLYQADHYSTKGINILFDRRIMDQIFI